MEDGFKEKNITEKKSRFGSIRIFHHYYELDEEKLARNNIVLLTCLILLIIFAPVFSSVKFQLLSSQILLSLIIVSSISSLNFKRKNLHRLISLSLLALILMWLAYFFGEPLIRMLSNLSIFVFTITITFSMIAHVAKEKDVKPSIILNAINSYLLMGIIAALNFDLIDHVSIEFFNGLHALKFPESFVPAFSDYLYFSFVTMTTLGYGDITPAIPIAKSATLIVSIGGQLYLTILVAMLVGKYLSNPGRK